MSAMAATGSTDVDDVVPMVATMAMGRRPAARSVGDRARPAPSAIHLVPLVRRRSSRLPRAPGPGSCTPSRSSCAPRPMRRPATWPSRRGRRAPARRRRGPRPRAPPRGRSAWTSTRCRSAGRRRRPAGPARRAASARRRPRAPCRWATCATASGSGPGRRSGTRPASRGRTRWWRSRRRTPGAASGSRWGRPARSTSARIAPIGSGASGAWAGSRGPIVPGSMGGRTGYASTSSR